MIAKLPSGVAPPALPAQVVADGRRGQPAAPRLGRGHPLPISRPQHPHAVDGDRMTDIPSGSRRAGCAGTRASGSGGGPGNRPAERLTPRPRPTSHAGLDQQAPPLRARLQTLPEHAEAMIYIAMIMTMSRRLAR